MLLQMMLLHSFLWLSDIHYIYIYIYIYMYIYIYIYTHPILYINSSVKGCLGCYCVLAIVNSAAVNTGVHVPF